MGDYESVTEILARFTAGDRRALDELLPILYEELRWMADHYMGREGDGHTLQTTALVHEAYLRLVGCKQVQWKSRSHFLAVAAQAMRRVLTDHARRKSRLKRGGGEKPTTLDWDVAQKGLPYLDLLALHEALNRLSQTHDRQAKVVELRFFGGLSESEVAEVLGVTRKTVGRDWRFAQAWILRELTPGDE
jgi:RNA polymerase sigma factor (TIGR02999 family)